MCKKATEFIKVVCSSVQKILVVRLPQREGSIGFGQAIPMLIHSTGLEMVKCRSLDHFLCQLKNLKSRKEKSEIQQVATVKHHRQQLKKGVLGWGCGRKHMRRRHSEKKTLCNAEGGLAKSKHPVSSQGLGVLKPLKAFRLLI